MRLEGKTAVVTGAGLGIGRAIAIAFAESGARVVVSDRHDNDAASVAAEIVALGGTAVSCRCDVSEEAEIGALVDFAEQQYGPIDVFCSNAGIGLVGGVELPDAVWEKTWQVNVMSHVWAARAVVPGMLERGSGYLVQVASAAGLLAAPGALPYTATKHAAVGLAECLSIGYGDRGIGVSVVCPLGVRTRTLENGGANPVNEAIKNSGDVLEPEDVAAAVVAGVAEEQFLILPHPEVAQYFQAKANDHGKWIRSLRRLTQRSAV